MDFRIGRLIKIRYIDARNLSDSRYTEHATFNQQIAIADVVVGNKRDLYGPQDEAKLASYVETTGGYGAELLFTEQGRLSAELLEGATARRSPCRWAASGATRRTPSSSGSRRASGESARRSTRRGTWQGGRTRSTCWAR